MRLLDRRFLRNVFAKSETLGLLSVVLGWGHEITASKEIATSKTSARIGSLETKKYT